MKIIIIEDEITALKKLEHHILKYDQSINIVARLSSIEQSVAWLKDSNNTFDIAFMDIQLTDGLSFDIFNHITIDKPIIFTTAFDQYAIDAFKVNSIDYLLKPINFTDISKAITKYKKTSSFASDDTIKTAYQSIEKKKYKDRFLVKLGNHIHSIKAVDIALSYAEGRTVFIQSTNNKKFIVDYTLEEISRLLEPKDFYRVNRSYIVNLNNIINVVIYSNSRLKLNINTPTDKDIIVSRERVKDFKLWLEGDDTAW